MSPVACVALVIVKVEMYQLGIEVAVASETLVEHVVRCNPGTSKSLSYVWHEVMCHSFLDKVVQRVCQTPSSALLSCLYASSRVVMPGMKLKSKYLDGISLRILYSNILFLMLRSSGIGPVNTWSDSVDAIL